MITFSLFFFSVFLLDERDIHRTKNQSVHIQLSYKNTEYSVKWNSCNLEKNNSRCSSTSLIVLLSVFCYCTESSTGCLCVATESLIHNLEKSGHPNTFIVFFFQKIRHINHFSWWYHLEIRISSNCLYLHIWGANSFVRIRLAFSYLTKLFPKSLVFFASRTWKDSQVNLVINPLIVSHHLAEMTHPSGPAS